MIEIENVGFSIGGRSILRDLSLVIPKGGVTALIGPNGAGKSTLLSLMARLEPLTAGRIRFDGLDITRTPTDRLARKLAVLRQESRHDARLTVRELVSFGRFPHHRGRPGPEDRAAIEATIERFGLAALAGRFSDELSGGERQRALVAMTFAQGTDYLLLDEPLNNLDLRHARELMRRIREAADDERRTVVIVLHDVNYAAAWADLVVGLRAGEVVAAGAPAEVLTPGAIFALYGAPVETRVVDGRLLVLHHR